MADESLRLSIDADNRHALAYNNLGVLEIKKGHLTSARSYFHAAANISSFSYEPHFNSAHLAYEVRSPFFVSTFIKSYLLYFQNLILFNKS